MNSERLKQLQEWHETGKHQKIISAILEIPQSLRDYELIGLLARAYNNNDEYDQAIEQLLSVKEKGENDPLWLFRLAYAYFYKDDHKKARALFERSKELDPQQSDVDMFLFFLRPYFDYWALHLEKAEVPEGREDFFTNGFSPAFSLAISNTAKGLCYECALMMSEDKSESFERLNARLTQKGFRADGYGWQEYLHGFIREKTPALHEKIGLDSELDTCGIYVYESRDDFYLLLETISTAVRSLYVVSPPQKQPEIHYLTDMYNDDYYPKFLVDQIKAELTAVVTFIMLGVHTYEEVQQKFDACIATINWMQEAFDKNDSEIETVARDSIGETLAMILERFEIDIDIEIAMRERDW